MHIFIVGGGPAGLYFAILMKLLDPSHRITLVERDGPDDTFGWGIVFSDQTFDYLHQSDPRSCRWIIDACEIWDNVDIVHRGERVTVRGNRFSGVARIAFLNILQRRCAELGVDLRFRTVISDPSLVPACDLLVAADGANSTLRRWRSEWFQPTLRSGSNKYIWLGTPRIFDGLTLIFRQHAAGAFAAHAYRFSRTTSTCIVECREGTWRAAGLDRMSEEETCDYLARVFADDLQGQPLLSNNFVKWVSFVEVRNRRWWHGPMILLGDSLHTAHFSIGSGTKLALGDAIGLAGCLRDHPRVEDALAAFERARKPFIEAYQDAARDSQTWFEQMERHLALGPIPFAFRAMTRSRKIDREKLRRRDPEFVAAYERLEAQVGLKNDE